MLSFGDLFVDSPAGGSGAGFEFPFQAQTDSARMGTNGQVISLPDENLCLLFNGETDIKSFRELVDAVKGRRSLSVFSKRTEEASANQYFQFYGYLSQQQNMLQDFVRTSTYQKAIHNNLPDFQVKGGTEEKELRTVSEEFREFTLHMYVYFNRNKRFLCAPLLLSY